ncbi:hypothetical protein ACIG47_08520 [Promicromonospora sp. NPDC052451]
MTTVKRFLVVATTMLMVVAGGLSLAAPASAQCQKGEWCVGAP